MSTHNNMKFLGLVKKYQKENKVKVEGDTLTILEQDKHKRQHIVWSLAEYNPQMMTQLFTHK